jgi:signal transduction histidine kinase/ActR/RegA family two-component response regulator
MAHMPIAQAEALDKGEWSGEVKVYSKDGREMTINSRWTLLRDHDGRPNAFLVTHTDLTEHKLLEAKFLRAQRLESVGALASGIAHDLNNVFTPILISTQLLTEGLDEATRANMIQILNNSAQRGSEMVKQVLTFARGCEAGSSLVQLKHLISDLERMMRDTFPSNIRIEKTFAPDLALVQGDSTQLYQVLINLCVNARDAMPNGGTLRIEAENIELDPSGADAKPAPGVCVTVVDTGSGMSPEIQRKIFEPFFTTKEIGKGTGLGLSTVMSLVKAHGGRLEVHSEVGLGTRFKVFLPAVPEKQCAPPPSEKKSQGGKGELLLIVDDESAIREIVKTTLEAYDYNVLVAKNGRDALAVYAEWERDIALVITDIAMPELDGFGMIRELRSAKPEVKVIAMTALCDQEKLDQLGRDGVIVLSKPVSSEQLLKSIHQVLHPVPQPAALEPSAR